jgi:hypothetical protein
MVESESKSASSISRIGIFCPDEIRRREDKKRQEKTRKGKAKARRGKVKAG